MGMADEHDDLEDYWADVRPRPLHSSNATNGEKYSRAMGIETQAEANREFERLVQSTMRNLGKTREEAERIERTSLGYYAGYYSVEVQARVERLFGAVHPVFGATTNPHQLTPEEVLRIGMQVGTRRRRRDSPIFCEHANEMPHVCPCDDDCYCKDHSCRTPRSV